MTLRLQSNYTSIVREESVFHLIMRTLSDIGGVVSTFWEIIVITFGILLTRLIFKDPEAFFEDQIRLAVTYFQKKYRDRNNGIN